MFDFSPHELIPLMALSIPIIAIVGGITAGIVRSIQRQRSFEMLQRERIAAIERGLDPDKIASLQRPLMFDDHGYTHPGVAAERLRQGLMIGGIITLFVGAALAIFLNGVADGSDGGKVWMVGLIPGAVGLALLLCSFLIRPIGSSQTPPQA